MKLAVFDLDGTLTKHFDEDEECFVQAFHDAFAINDVNRDWLGYEHHTDLFVVGEVFRSKRGRLPTEVEFSLYVENYLARLTLAAQTRAEMVGEIPGARSLVELLATGRSWRTAIASGGWERSARYKLKASGFSMDAIPSAFGEAGPSRDRVVQTAIDRARVQYREDGFEKIVMLGDGLWDVGTARILGLPFVGVAGGLHHDLLASAGASHVLDDFRDVSRVMACLDEAQPPT